MTLTEFLLARIAEDEELPGVATERIYVCDDGHIETPTEQWDDGSDRLPNHYNSWRSVYDPARVLAECAAKRAIVEVHEPFQSETRGECCWICGPGGAPWPCETLRALAKVYADHPDYLPEWTP